MLALKSRIWERLQNKNKTKTNVFNQHMARKKKKEQERKGGVLDKRDLGDIPIERNA